MITAGVDVGARFVKVIVLNDGKAVRREKALVGFDVLKSVDEAFKAALNEAGLRRDDVDGVVSTGVGKDVALNPLVKADRAVSIITADAVGIHRLMPSVRTVIDVGAEETRGIRLDVNGGVKDFVINERCAAGAGTFIEAMARALDASLDEMGKLALMSTKSISISAQCCVFAESEVVTLAHSKVSKEDVAKAIYDAIASRVASTALRIGIEKDVALIGGVALDRGFVQSLRKELKVEILIPEFPEFIGAFGAALIAAGLVR